MGDGIDKVTVFTPDGGKSISINRLTDWNHRGIRVAYATGDRRQVPVHRNQHDQHHAPPENWHRVAGQRQANRCVIENGTTFNRSQHTNRNPDCGQKSSRRRQVPAWPESAARTLPIPEFGFSWKCLNHRALRPKCNGDTAATSVYLPKVQPAIARDALGDPTFARHDHQTRSPGIMWTKANVRRVIPINGDDES